MKVINTTSIDKIRIVRNSFFEMAGEKRWTRIVAIAFLIGSVWCFADWLSN